MNYLFISLHTYTTFQTNLVVKHSIDQVRSGHVISTRYVIHCPIWPVCPVHPLQRYKLVQWVGLEVNVGSGLSKVEGYLKIDACLLYLQDIESNIARHKTELFADSWNTCNRLKYWNMSVKYYSFSFVLRCVCMLWIHSSCGTWSVVYHSRAHRWLMQP